MHSPPDLRVAVRLSACLYKTTFAYRVSDMHTCLVPCAPAAS